MKKRRKRIDWNIGKSWISAQTNCKENVTGSSPSRNSPCGVRPFNGVIIMTLMGLCQTSPYKNMIDFFIGCFENPNTNKMNSNRGNNFEFQELFNFLHWTPSGRRFSTHLFRYLVFLFLSCAECEMKMKCICIWYWTMEKRQKWRSTAHTSTTLPFDSWNLVMVNM